MRPPIRFPDAQRAMRDALRALLSDRPEPAASGVSVGTRLPDWRAPEAPALPYVMVRLDDATRDARLNGRATVRVTVFHRDEGRALDLAALCEALALAARTPEVRSVVPVDGPVPTTDPDTGEALAFFRVTAHLRPTQIDT